MVLIETKPQASPEGATVVEEVDMLSLAEIAKSSQLKEIKVGETITIERLDKVEVSVTFTTESTVIIKIGDNKMVLTCTDERDILELNDAEGLGKDNVVFIRVPGGLHGLFKAIESVEQGANADEIVRQFAEMGCVCANHRDNHEPGSKKGCGYCALCTLDSAKTVFGYEKEYDAEKIISQYESFAADVMLGGDHVGGAFVMSFLEGEAIDPTHAQNAFFGLDIGLIKDLLDKNDLGLSNEKRKNVLIKLVYDNMAAVFVLTGGAVKDFHVLLSGNDERDEYLRSVVETAHKQFLEKAEALQEMIEERSAEAPHH